MSAGPWDRVTKSGQRLYRRDWALIEDASFAALVRTPRVVQGSWSGGGVAASAGTHAGAGAADLSVAGLTVAQSLALVEQLRKRWACAWLRNPAYGWPARLGGPHIHLIVADSPGLSPAAQAQVVAYNRGLNGLASKARDPHTRPAQRPFLLPGQLAGVAVPPLVKTMLDRMRYGARNSQVAELQKGLRITADGWYGPATDKAVRAHQRKLFGVCDPAKHSFVGPLQSQALGLILIPAKR